MIVASRKTKLVQHIEGKRRQDKQWEEAIRVKRKEVEK